MKVGETYIFNNHLHVIITDPQDDVSQAVAVVNVTGHHPNKDQTCVIEVGDHPWIIKKSVVAYKFAFILRLAEQEDFVRQSTKQRDVSPELLAKIQEGTDSDYTEKKVQTFVNNACREYRRRSRPSSAG